MEIDKKLNILARFLDDSLRLKICLSSLFEFILNMYDKFIQYDVYDKERLVDLYYYQTHNILTWIKENKAFEEEFIDFLTKNIDILDFLENNGLDPNVIKTPLNFQFKFIDILEGERKISDEHINDLNKAIEKTYLELSAVNKIRDEIKVRKKEHEKCYICSNKGKMKLGTHKCDNCGRSICLKHLFIEKMCKNCCRTFIQEKKKSL